MAVSCVTLGEIMAHGLNLENDRVMMGVTMWLGEFGSVQLEEREIWGWGGA